MGPGVTGIHGILGEGGACVGRLGGMSPAVRPRCPRCGYDLSGIAASWADRCPLEGVCSECGHALRWGDVFDPSNNDLPWLVEHARSWRGYGRRVVGTFVRACWPPVYWRAVGVEARVRVWPIVVLVALVWGVPYVISGVVHGMELHRWWMRGSSAYIQRLNLTSADLVPGAAANGLAHPVGRFWDPTLSSWAFTLNTWPHALAFGVILHSCWPVLFLIMPVVRRRARLRAAHLARAWVTGLLMLLPAWCLHLAAISQNWRGGLGRGHWSEDPATWLWVSVPLVGLWWWSAITIGWKVEQGGRVFWLLGLASVLAAVVAGLTADIDLFARWWWWFGWDRP